MEWMLAWFVFGSLAAHEISGLSTSPGGGPVLAILYGVAGLVGLVMMIRRAIRRARAAQLYPSLAISLLGTALCVWLLQQRMVPPAWAGSFFVAAGLLALSSCAILGGIVLAWRRREALRDRRSRELRASERQRLLERDASSPLHQLVAELENPPIEDEADLLPPRPPRAPRARRA
ncbi:hypothetical protein QTH87_20220 [Variovorax sp. J22P168]|uniref:hypothetical protein n=1 Tax=Variovorax jilinensis TaxID=3053513 RepID=UPI0025771154|nr:hypothetical protein [Variovorax sp. J22P168]MDM0014781.1 hypothetical protein [Variovorax sp. J22P168]